ncbi:hypothetical protein BT96DRAFT_1058800 [Gymnopus androsaceus JB14]|uniref:Uncharacterized protein n=1 Tax=Gymnopus androsaceus JB14 TaxID=1447944 RepID=A0A6A4H3M7_9AGAR|nr:hypothetical protein BT96DRAFT_1058800 [Gymnopus androsaceus JB14]
MKYCSGRTLYSANEQLEKAKKSTDSSQIKSILGYPKTSWAKVERLKGNDLGTLNEARFGYLNRSPDFLRSGRVNVGDYELQLDLREKCGKDAGSDEEGTTRCVSGGGGANQGVGETECICNVEVSRQLYELPRTSNPACSTKEWIGKLSQLDFCRLFNLQASTSPVVETPRFNRLSSES